MSNMPAGVQIDIEFTAGVWTNVTAKVLATTGISIQVGRTSEFSAPQVGTCTFMLDNRSGDFTALNAAGAYYPNVVPRKRVRISYNSGATVRYIGYIKAWTPKLQGALFPVMTINAVDRLSLLDQRTLRAMLDEEMLTDHPAAFWPLVESAPAAVFSDISGNHNPPLRPAAGTVATLTNTSAYDSDSSNYLSVAQPGANQFVGVSVDGFTYPTNPAQRAASSGTTIECWVYWPTGADSTQQAISVLDPSTSAQVWADLTSVSGPSFSSSSPPWVIGSWNHLAIVTTNPQTVYLNGVALTGTTGASSFSGSALWVRIAGRQSAAAQSNIGISRVALYNTALSAGRVQAHYFTGLGAIGELSGTRITRLLGYAGLTSSDWNVAPGVETMGRQPIAGKTVPAALNEVAITEGGGALAYINTDGKATFRDRTHRTTTTPAITLDASMNIHPDVWAPFYDDLTTINDSTVTLADGTTAEYVDTASVATSGTITDTANSYANTLDSALRLAQYRVNASHAKVRFPQLTINVAVASNAATIYAALANTVIGSRLRITTIPKLLTLADGTTSRIFHVDTIDAFIEGYSELIATDTVLVTFDLSPADAPPRAVWDGAFWQDNGDLTLTATITNAATSLQITSSGPTLSTAAGDYPQQIKVDQEVLSISAAPASGTSPQTVTVTRGQAGTFADAHTIGAAITLYPQSSWTL